MTDTNKLTEFLDEQIEKSKKYCNSGWASLFMEIKRVVEKFAILQEYNVIIEKKLEPLINQREKLVSRPPNDDLVYKIITTVSNGYVNKERLAVIKEKVGELLKSTPTRVDENLVDKIWIVNQDNLSNSIKAKAGIRKLLQGKK